MKVIKVLVALTQRAAPLCYARGPKAAMENGRVH